MIRLILATAVTLLSTLSIALEARVIRHNAVLDETEMLLFGILKTAIQQVDPSITFDSPAEFIPQSRAEADVLSGRLSLVWASSTPEREQNLKAIRIPVIKGLLGHRIFIIRPENQYKFDQVHTLEDLKQLTVGQGIDWGDTAVLRSAGLPIVTANKYESLFYMTDGGRFDYFSRAVHEPWEELRHYQHLDLTIEKNLLLVYPMTMHFYVAPDNHELHDLIYRGLELAMLNGSYDEYFLNHPMVKDALERSNVQNRRVIRIGNPHLPSDTPVDRPEFWLNLL